MTNINDGGHDAPMTRRDARFIVWVLVGIAVAGIVGGALVTLVFGGV